jgi:membrane-associated phospholipid phosphatase
MFKWIYNFVATHKHYFWLLALLPILFWFKYLEANLDPKYYIYSPLDDKIPFVSVFVVPYVVWFFYIAFAMLYTGLYSKYDFYRLVIFLGLGMSVAYTLYMFFPNAQNLRPEITGTDIFSRLVAYLYATDTPTNVCPSVHVINSLAVSAALHHSTAFAKIRFARPALHILTILIIMSTVLIKQHSVLDIFAGIAVGAVLYIPLYLLPNLKAAFFKEQKAGKPLNEFELLE